MQILYQDALRKRFGQYRSQLLGSIVKYEDVAPPHDDGLFATGDVDDVRGKHTLVGLCVNRTSWTARSFSFDKVVPYDDREKEKNCVCCNRIETSPYEVWRNLGEEVI